MLPCLTVPGEKIVCTSSRVPLPGCSMVSRANVGPSLADLLCTPNTITPLPSCLTVTSANINENSINPNKLAAGVLPSSIVVTDASLAPNNISMSQLQDGELSPSIQVTNDNLQPGSINPRKLGQATGGITVGSANIPDNIIDLSKLKDGLLADQVSVTNDNLAQGTLDTAMFKQGVLPVDVAVTDDNIPKSSVSVTKLQCGAGGLPAVDAPCVKVSAANLECVSGDPAPLGACVSVLGSQVLGNIDAAQVTGPITDATISPANVQCQPGDVGGVTLSACVTVNPVVQLKCPSGGNPTPIPCVEIAGSQINGTLSNVIVPGSQLTGVINPPSTGIDGSKIIDDTIPGLSLKTPKWKSATLLVSNNNDSPGQNPEICCDLGAVPIACNSPMVLESQNLQGSKIYWSNSGSIIQDAEDPANAGKMCCKYYSVRSDAPSPGVKVIYSAVCLPY